MMAATLVQMGVVERRNQADRGPLMPEVSRYLSVDPQTLGQLRILRIRDVELQLDSHRLIVRGTPVHLPHKEFVILQQLMDNAGRVVWRRDLLNNA
jgi:DNA-binding response OmpR family regulator